MWDWKWTADFLTHWNHLFLICQNGKIYYLNYNTVWRKWQQKDKGREWGSLCLFFLSLPPLWFWLLLFGGLLLVTLWLRDGSIDLWQLRAIDTSEGSRPNHTWYLHLLFSDSETLLVGRCPTPHTRHVAGHRFYDHVPDLLLRQPAQRKNARFLYGWARRSKK